MPPSSPPPRRVSVVIPAHDEAASIGGCVRAVLAQAAPGVEVEAIVVDDASTDGTAEAARAAGARVLRMEIGGNPAAARNRGAAASTGDPIVFLDADCLPVDGWLAAFLAAHDRGEVVVGGSLDLPAGLSATARCDFYCGWYLIHPRRPAGPVPHHPPPNLSVRRAPFLGSQRFTERQPFSYTNEERAWQAELRDAGHRIWFEPLARAYHYNRPGFLNLLRRNYRWAYTALPSKAQTGAARMAWLYRHPVLLIAASGPLALAHTAFIVGCWVRAGVFEPLLQLPAILLSRFAYAAGLAVGGIQWLRRRDPEAEAYRPRWQ
ncbi:MAG TPA: glycosyltransferase [Thermoanaerobaculia bacterium]|nr:glycosyltransferase [Thermoanaerobaculia bacterium]